MVLEQLAGGFATILTPAAFAIFVFALTIGMLAGAIPGMSGLMTVVLLIPVTFVMDPTIAFMMLSVIYAASVYGGSISSILFRVPGSSPAIMTLLDGYPMNQQGRLDEAISTAVFSSAFGGIVGAVILIWFSPVLSEWAINLSSPEFFAVILFGLALVSTIGGGRVAKATMAMGFGIALGTFGFDPLAAEPRFTFGIRVLLSGVSFIPILLGVFAVAEVFKQIRSGGEMVGSTTDGDDSTSWLRGIIPPFSYLKRFRRIYVVNSIVGTLIGILPGAGATAGAIFGYSFGKRLVPESLRERFGTGVPEGVAAPEVANNAAASGAFIPLLTLGIPGSGTTAVLLAAFILHGIRPGPQLLDAQGPLVYTMFAGLLLVNVGVLLANRPIVKVFTQVRHIPRELLFALIMMFIVMGAFAARNIMFDLWLMVLFGIIGYYMLMYNYSLASFAIGLVLGPIAEPFFRRSLVKAQGDFMVFLDRPVSAVLVVASVVVFLLPLLEQTEYAQRIRERLGLTELEGDR
jgi:putative tricarboxylic transport membrane protein